MVACVISSRMRSILSEVYQQHVATFFRMTDFWGPCCVGISSSCVVTLSRFITYHQDRKNSFKYLSSTRTSADAAAGFCCLASMTWMPGAVTFVWSSLPVQHIQAILLVWHWRLVNLPLTLGQRLLAISTVTSMVKWLSYYRRTISMSIVSFVLDTIAPISLLTRLSKALNKNLWDDYRLTNDGECIQEQAIKFELCELMTFSHAETKE